METGYKAMQYHQINSRIDLYKVNQELIIYGTCEINTLTEIKNTVVNLNNKTTAVEKECLNRILF